jgi:hypothetical protein
MKREIINFIDALPLRPSTIAPARTYKAARDALRVNPKSIPASYYRPAPCKNYQRLWVCKDLCVEAIDK